MGCIFVIKTKPLNTKQTLSKHLATLGTLWTRILRYGSTFQDQKTTMYNLFGSSGYPLDGLSRILRYGSTLQDQKTTMYNLFGSSGDPLDGLSRILRYGSTLQDQKNNNV